MKPLRWLLSRLGWMVAGVIAAVVLLVVIAQNRRPELEAWHLHAPASEYRAGDTDADLAAYRAREERVFAEVETIVAPGRDRLEPWNRYRSASTRELVAELGGQRTFEIRNAAPRGVAVLLHGLSDGPYSLRGVAQVLADAGWEVIVLRLPGHGTVPAGMLEMSWLDWRGAVDLAMRDAARRAGGKLPLLIGGYSNGAALALDYSLRALGDSTLPRASRLIFLSPAFAVSESAVVAPWIHRASRLPGLAKLAWTDISPEFDPFKYNSFTVNAGAQVHHLTTAVEAELAALEAASRLAELPPVLSIQSVVDSTIPPLPSLRRLLRRLRGAGNELVLFDVNRLPGVEAMLRPDALELTTLAETLTDLPFAVTLVTNVAPGALEVEARTRPAGSRELAVEPLGLAWPPGVYSLSHVAIPFPPDDPVYGREPGTHPPFPLGRLELHGETRTLRIPSDLLLRQRYNPFFSYLALRVARFAAESPAAN